MAPLNEGRSVNPGDTACTHRTDLRYCPLNEGRSVNPGDTGRYGYWCQRRRPRSTKAGASTPATPGAYRGLRGVAVHERSTKAGASTPATRSDEPSDSLRWSRSTKAGASTPATLGRQPLNPLVGAVRSTKAGASTPATHELLLIRIGILRRSTKAGASTQATRMGSPRVLPDVVSAQRRPERQPRRHEPWRGRTKETPRVAQRRPERQPRRHPVSLPRLATGPWALNEGRSVNPGDTQDGADMPARRSIRSTKAGASTPATPVRGHPELAFGPARSTKAGASTPATLLNYAKGQYRDKPSLVHGRGSLDDAFAAISRDFGRYPVRMVGIKQSRLP